MTVSGRGTTQMTLRTFKRARLTQDLVATPPWVPRIVLKAGEMVWVTPATNMPEDSPIKMWVHPFTPEQKALWGEHAEGAYGIGAYAEDYEIVMG